MARFILISGAFHAGWCWERLVPMLEAAGHTAIAPDLLGMGADPTLLSTVSLADWADQVADLVRSQPEPVILVGHSRGGIVISEAAERVPDRIEMLVYLTALLVPDGRAASDLMSEANPFVRLLPDGTSAFASEGVGDMFYSLTAPEWVEQARRMLGPEPLATFATPLQLSEERYGGVRRAYIECALDQAAPLALQRDMQRALPCSPVITLQSDHSPFFSAPAELAGALSRIAAEVQDGGQGDQERR